MSKLCYPHSLLPIIVSHLLNDLSSCDLKVQHHWFICVRFYIEIYCECSAGFRTQIAKGSSQLYFLYQYFICCTFDIFIYYASSSLYVVIYIHIILPVCTYLKMLNELKLNCRVCALNINEIDCVFSLDSLLAILNTIRIDGFWNFMRKRI